MQALFDALADSESFRQIRDAIGEDRYPYHVWGVDLKTIPLLARAFSGEERTRLIVTYDEKRGRELLDGVRFFDRESYYYPAKDALFYYADIHSNATVKSRMEIFRKLAEKEPVTVITTVEGLMDLIPPITEITGHRKTISVGDTLSRDEFARYMTTLGYEKTTMVELPGQFSIRGDIVDIYPLTEECPYRVSLWGDDIETIRSFDAESQRSIMDVDTLVIYPSCEMVLDEKRIDHGIRKIDFEFEKQKKVLEKEFRTEQKARLTKTVSAAKEELAEFNSTMGLDSMVRFFYDDTVSFLDYFPEDVAVFIDDPERVMRRAGSYEEEFKTSMEGRLSGGYILPTQAEVLTGARKIVKRLSERQTILFSDLYKKEPAWKEQGNTCIETRDTSDYHNSFETLVDDIAAWKKKQFKVVIVSPSATRGKRLAANLREREIESHFSEDRFHRMKPGEVMVTLGRIDKGYVLPDAGLAVISEGDIFTAREISKGRKRPRYEGGDRIASFSDIVVGDYVVHRNHGIGIYQGIEKVETEGRLKDYITIEYAKGSKLFIPVDQLDMIGKLSGKDGAKPKLSRLGGGEWEKTRQRVKGHVADIAEELVELYALRETMNGFAYSPDTAWQREFEELFPYEETPDQEQAIRDTKRDMESGKIMDRLICGDVGFGKTEVAIRAAFKAVQDNRQVLYLVPTTILAEQHYNTFTERMKDFPVNIRMLSRFCTPKEVKETLELLKNGMADIVIGTHRLLSKDVECKNLGLLIIDEEQRFGVKHKEQIKQLKKTVDVLTLTATPIPRTLHMSLVGLRDISLLSEPPVDRLPIQTFVMEYDIEFVKEAINRELSRGGQVFYVYNRVNTIADITAELSRVLPDARISFAHGKMNERELEEVMRAFLRKEIDVLVSTTIIETGLDIANVNTMIVHDADRFGLSQLYQLRGRVGRSNRAAYAFLMYKRDKLLAEVAEKRLAAIREFTDLGSGYKISMRDLEIRGAGNLLGQEQSGNIEAVGYDLYCKMLSDAIKRLSGTVVEREFTTSVELPLDAYIPDDYVKNEFVKLDLYKRISKIEDPEEKDLLVEEAKDRFGTPPKEFMRLLSVAVLKAKAHKAYMTDLKYVSGEVRMAMLADAPVMTERIGELLIRHQGEIKLLSGNQSGFSVKVSKTLQDELISKTEEAIEAIGSLIREDTNETDT